MNSNDIQFTSNEQHSDLQQGTMHFNEYAQHTFQKHGISWRKHLPAAYIVEQK